MIQRYAADAAISPETNSDEQEYETFTGTVLAEVLSRAEARSITNEAYFVRLETWNKKYHRWEEEDYLDIYFKTFSAENYPPLDIYDEDGQPVVN